MGKQAVIKWNASQLKSIKRDILLFDSFFYDPFLLELQIGMLKNVSTLVNYSSDKLINEIYATVEYLEGKNAMSSFNLNEFKAGKIEFVRRNLNNQEINDIRTNAKNYELAHKSFVEKHDNTAKLFKKDPRSAFLKYVTLLNDFTSFADHHIRLTSVILGKIKPNLSITPMIENLHDVEFGKETEVIKLVIKNLPIPAEITPLDEILDFKSDQDNRRRYLGLINWINKISKSNLNINEINDELEFYTLEFENRLKLENTKYNLTNLEIIVSLPIEIIENIIKLNWSKIPKSLFQFKKNRVNLLIGESKASGKEVAYLYYANEKFGQKK